jgi:hypothetical protein
MVARSACSVPYTIYLAPDVVRFRKTCLSMLTHAHHVRERYSSYSLRWLAVGSLACRPIWRAACTASPCVDHELEQSSVLSRYWVIRRNIWTIFGIKIANRAASVRGQRKLTKIQIWTLENIFDVQASCTPIECSG